MITKQDCMSILVDLEDRGLNVNAPMRRLISSKDVPLDVLKFIAQNKGFEAAHFYEILRIKHNESKSKLYTNILREQDDEVELAITLSSLLTQIFIHSKKNSVSPTFFTNVRAHEIIKALNEYTLSGNPSLCIKVLKLIKADLVVFEFLADRRELD